MFTPVPAYGAPFGLLMAQCLTDHLSQAPDLLTWAPLSSRRLRERGFDQARLLARRAGQRLNVPLVPTLKKVRHTRPQSSLEGESARRAEEFAALLTERGLEVILWDERMTTLSAIGFLNQTNTRGKKRKGVVDTVAAVIILQSYLDSRKNQPAGS